MSTTDAIQSWIAAQFGSVRLFEVDAGSVITDPRTGQELVVEDGAAVNSDRGIYLTRHDYGLFKAKMKELGA